MSEIIKVYKQAVPAMRFIGKKYSDYDHWGEWFCNGWFDIVENAMEFDTDIKGAVISFENGLCPRFTTPDEKGNVILDYCFRVK